MQKLTILLFLSSLSVCGQTALVTEIKHPAADPDPEYRFPNVEVSGKAKISKKINDTLRSTFLYAKPGTPENKLFDEVRTTPQHNATLNDLSYKVVYNKKNILALLLEAEGCGAYCEGFSTHYNFNLNTGNQLFLDSIFSAKGREALTASINNDRENQINNMIGNLKDSLQSKRILSDSLLLTEHKEKLELYTECLNQKIKAEYINKLDFALSGNFLTVYIHRCSAHYNMTLDDLWDIEVRMSLNFWKENLTAYGKTLLMK